MGDSTPKWDLLVIILENRLKKPFEWVKNPFCTQLHHKGAFDREIHV